MFNASSSPDAPAACAWMSRVSPRDHLAAHGLPLVVQPHAIRRAERRLGQQAFAPGQGQVAGEGRTRAQQGRGVARVTGRPPPAPGERGAQPFAATPDERGDSARDVTSEERIHVMGLAQSFAEDPPECRLDGPDGAAGREQAVGRLMRPVRRGALRGTLRGKPVRKAPEAAGSSASGEGCSPHRGDDAARSQHQYRGSRCTPPARHKPPSGISAEARVMGTMRSAVPVPGDTACTTSEPESRPLPDPHRAAGPQLIAVLVEADRPLLQPAGRRADQSGGRLVLPEAQPARPEDQSVAFRQGVVIEDVPKSANDGSNTS